MWVLVGILVLCAVIVVLGSLIEDDEFSIWDEYFDGF